MMVESEKPGFFIALPGIDCKLSSDNDKIISDLEKKLFEFVIEKSNDYFEIFIEFREGENRFENNPKRDPVKVTPKGDVIAIKTDSFEGEYNPLTKKGRVAIKASLWPLKRFLRICYSLAAADKNVLLLHSSSIIKGEKAILFSAPSRTGKSTVARLSGYPPLNEDANILSERQGRVYCSGNPLGGLSSDYFRGSFEVDKIFFIKQSKETKLKAMSTSEIISKLIANQFIILSIVFKENPELLGKIFQTSTRLASKLKGFELYFEKNDEFRKFL